MTHASDPRRLFPSIGAARTRRRALGLLGAGALIAGLVPGALAAQSDNDPSKGEPPADDDVLNEAAVLRDPDIPVAGNSTGNITIVEWFDYQCPYCRKLEPDLAQVVKADGKVRMVFKDWPILGPASVYTSGLVLATRYQDKFLEAHATLMSLDIKLTEAGARDRLAKAGIDVDRALADLETNKAAIGAVLKRNDDQAAAFGFKGTPAFIVGKFRVPGVLTKEQFVQVIADARKAAKKK
jgi:protein-disulfide isomerase